MCGCGGDGSAAFVLGTSGLWFHNGNDLTLRISFFCYTERKESNCALLRLNEIEIKIKVLTAKSIAELYFKICCQRMTEVGISLV